MEITGSGPVNGSGIKKGSPNAPNHTGSLNGFVGSNADSTKAKNHCGSLNGSVDSNAGTAKQAIAGSGPQNLSRREIIAAY